MKKSLFYIILAGLLWGTSAIFVKVLAPYGFTPFQMTAVRGLVSFICTAGFALIFNRKLFKVKPKNLIFFVGIGATLFLTASCYYTAMQMTSVSTAVVLMYTSPLYVTVFSAIFLGERLSPLKIGAIALMLVGCALVSGVVGGLRFDLVGILIGILSGLTYASYNIITKITLRIGSNPVSTNVYSFLFMSIIAFFFAEPAKLIESAAAEPLASIPLLIGLGVCTFVLPYLLYTSSMKTLSAGSASALAIVEPMAATLYGIIIFGEIPDVFSIVGIVLILTAVVLIGIAEEMLNKKKTENL